MQKTLKNQRLRAATALVTAVVLLVSSLLAPQLYVAAANEKDLLTANNGYGDGSFEQSTIAENGSMLIPAAELDLAAAKEGKYNPQQLANTLSAFEESSKYYGSWMAIGSDSVAGNLKYVTYGWAGPTRVKNTDKNGNSSDWCLSFPTNNQHQVRRVSGLKNGATYVISFKCKTSEVLPSSEFYCNWSYTDNGYTELVPAYNINVKASLLNDAEAPAKGMAITTAWQQKSFAVTYYGPETNYFHFRWNATKSGHKVFLDDFKITEADLVTVRATVQPQCTDFGIVEKTEVHAARGTTATVTATPYAGFSFAGWYEGSSEVSKDATYTFTANANRNLTARFSGTTANLIGISASGIDTATFENVAENTSALLPINSADTEISQAAGQLVEKAGNTLNDFFTKEEFLGYWAVPSRTADPDPKKPAKLGFADYETPLVVANPLKDSVNSSQKVLRLACHSRGYVRRVQGLQKGKKYRLTYKALCAAENQIAIAISSAYDTSLPSGNAFSGNGAWQQYSTEFIYNGESSAFLQVIRQDHVSGKPLYIDDLQLEEVISLVQYNAAWGSISPEVDAN